ncbi:hypothetical protein [Aquamicrobium soli]|jgi:hypothetical protein|uniref:Uncharacterized protein n=1 Tax=Aquamicrobium soli TaxID=1811518 RepID=A0ABV7K3S3_9HYPH
MAEAVRHPETRDVWPRALLMFAVGLLAFIGLALVALKLIFATAPYPELLGAADRGNAASPALQRFPEADLAAFRAIEDSELAKLGWEDRANGIARIPIDDAMRMVAEHGLPRWSVQADDCGPVAQAAPRAPQSQDCLTATPPSKEPQP